MRIRLPVAGTFFGISLIACYFGFSKIESFNTNDKILHFLAFFVLTTCFYWVCFPALAPIMANSLRNEEWNTLLKERPGEGAKQVIDTTRRRVVNLTLIAMFLVGGIGSEFVQSMLPYRKFDPYDILANLFGCSLALALCTWYHKRQLERKRHARTSSGGAYETVEGEDQSELGIIHEVNEEDDNEMGPIDAGDDELGDIGGIEKAKKGDVNGIVH